ncbi:DUF2264 domain-containing protein [Pseudooceanicola algae]|uniref:DUF2264 domain-containing protein n=1 Tax=Pseudooceanicola algae TaxID=1537215 RepID=A0A418SHC4_9RHOB|nr:DUF2264 domain-containing protein [Pseudooceanicola algae]QPM90451.1 hypothetical protein PSAL_016900 [Pseudooceanicola algae]
MTGPATGTAVLWDEGGGLHGTNPLAGQRFETRADLVQALARLVAPLAPYRSAGGARLRLSPAAACFDGAAADLEGFARPLWGLAAAAAGGDALPDWPVLRAGLSNGTDPAHPEYWGDPGDLDQRLVDLAAVGFALLTARADLWDPLPPVARANVTRYLQRATQGRASANNWMFFRLLIDAGLRAVGTPVPANAGQAERDGLEALYLGEGWYRDGPGRRVDHYTGFAFHTYGLLLHHLAPETDRGAHLDRARLFAPQFAAWFDASGRGLAYGRSMTYRFAMAAFLGAYALADPDPVLPWGVLKGLVLRHLRWWSGLPIADRDGVLPVGYAYPNPAMAEDYNSPNSSYWALKAFLVLAMPDDHPFWRAEELPLPAPATTEKQAAPGLLIASTGGQKVALASGQESTNFRHGAEKYAKFAYSTRFAFAVETREAGLNTASLDGMLGVQAEGRPWRIRDGVVEARIGDRAIASRWQAYDDVTVETWLLHDGDGHLRLHRIDSAVPMDTVEGGFAVTRRDGTRDLQRHEAGFADVTSTATSLIRGLDGAGRRGRVHGPAANTHLLFPRAWVPQLVGRIPAGQTLLVSYCAAGDAPCDRPDAIPAPDDLFPLWEDMQPIGALSGAPFL